MAQHSDQLKKLLGEIIYLHLSPEGSEWVLNMTNSPAQSYTAFAAAPRRTGKRSINLTEDQQRSIDSLRPGFQINGWAADRLVRVFLLMHVDSTDKETYLRKIEELFKGAEVNELIALYASLPVLEYPESWTGRCSEGIRSNIGDVLLAIMCRNPFPADFLDDAAWNQLVLKAFFTEKPIHEITGLDRRANYALAATLSDYAHERWAAHREVNPQLWRLVGKFLDPALFPDIQKLSVSSDPIEREAAALACSDSNFPPASELLHKNSSTHTLIETGKLTWDILAEKKSDYVLQP